MCGDNGGVDGDGPVIAPDGRGLPAWWRRYLWWVDPRTWGIPVRSAIAAAAVVLVSFVVVGAAVAAQHHRRSVVQPPRRMVPWLCRRLLR